MTKIDWCWKHFSHLSSHDLYEVLRLRAEVFVVEQKCVYQDLDGLDLEGWHLLGWTIEDRKLAAYLRVTTPGSRYAEYSLGRVVTSPSSRRQGLGKEMTQVVLSRIEEEFGNVPMRISAQAYLEKFYSDFGFSRVSEPYQEDGIPHVEMFRK